MLGNEIEVPKELREFMLEKAEETLLGQKNGAYKQYRYGNLHIREYAICHAQQYLLRVGCNYSDLFVWA